MGSLVVYVSFTSGHTERGMLCSLFLEFSVLKKNYSESSVGIIRIISSVGDHRGEECKQTSVNCLSQ